MKIKISFISEIKKCKEEIAMVQKREKKEKILREKIMTEITNYFILHGYAPSMREIGDAVGLKSTSSVAHHINILTDEGKLESDAKVGASRAYRVSGMKVVFEQKG